MVRESKFKKGMKVKNIINKFETYEVLEVLRNELLVKAESNNLEFKCRKGLFEVIEND